MFEKFTQKAKNAMETAKNIAEELNHPYIGSEHVLYGISAEENSVAQKALLNQGIKEEMILEKIKEFVDSEEKNESNVLEFTPKIGKVFDEALREAIRLGAGFIGTEHILISLLKERESIAVKILLKYKINIPMMYDEILNLSSVTSLNKGKTIKSDTPNLDKFSRDFTKMAAKNKFDPVIGREKEIQRVIQVLSRRTKNNPCLIGEPGVGKTAIIEGLAQKVIQDNVPDMLKNKRVVSLDLSSMVAGAKYRGEFEKRIKKAIQEVKEAENIILFIDELHTIVGAGAADGAIDASNILKPSLARGEVQVVGATTIDEYRKHIEKDMALERRFQSIMVEEPTSEETLRILKGLRERYEAHHGVSISDEAIKAAVKLSERYVTDKFLPDKAIDLIDEASSKVKLKVVTAPPEVKNLEKKLFTLENKKEEAIKEEEYEKAGRIKKEQQKLRKEKDKLLDEWSGEYEGLKHNVDEEDIADVISLWTGIPVTKLTQSETKKLMNLENKIQEKIVGQDEAVKAISKAIRRGRIGLKDPKKPTGSFLFLGPTGVGKTELAKVLSEIIFGTEDALIRVDMSEYMEKHNASKLIGSPPGYVGHDEPGQLSEQVRRRPYSVVLFDEIEKAHSDIFNMLLQILDDGHITDSKGKKIDFKNSIVIMTSNMGAKDILNKNKLGFGLTETEGEKYEQIKEKVMKIVKKDLSPEFINRIDEMIVFRQLNLDNMKDIVGILLDELKNRIKENMFMETEFTDELKKYIAEEGYDERYGARPLKRVIQSKIENVLAEKILDDEIKKDKKLKVDYKKGEIKFIGE